MWGKFHLLTRVVWKSSFKRHWCRKWWKTGIFCNQSTLSDNISLAYNIRRFNLQICSSNALWCSNLSECDLNIFYITIWSKYMVSMVLQVRKVFLGETNTISNLISICVSCPQKALRRMTIEMKCFQYMCLHLSRSDWLYSVTRSLILFYILDFQGKIKCSYAH